MEKTIWRRKGGTSMPAGGHACKKSWRGRVVASGVSYDLCFIVWWRWRGLGVTRGVWGGSPKRGVPQKMVPWGRLFFWGACSSGSFLKGFDGIVKGARRIKKKRERP